MTAVRCLYWTAENSMRISMRSKIVENNMEEDIDMILAVGTGTIHDISRYMAFQYKIPFISVPTAASVDGFTSTVAGNDLEWTQKDSTVGTACCCLC